MPALQYLQAFSCRNLSCSCPAHACGTIFTNIWLQERVLQTVLRYNIYKHLAAGTSPADCPAAVLRMPAHETVVAHIRKLLDGKFCYNRLHETPAHIRQRLQQVEDYMNSPSFSACGGDGLLGLTKELRPRCEALIKLGGERLPK